MHNSVDGRREGAQKVPKIRNGLTLMYLVYVKAFWVARSACYVSEGLPAKGSSMLS